MCIPTNMSLCVGRTSTILHTTYEDNIAASLIFTDVFVRANTIFICGNATAEAVALQLLCTSKLDGGPGVAFPGLRLVALDSRWALDSSRCSGRTEPLPMPDGPPAHGIEQLGRTVRHVLRSSNICHYFFETFHPFYVHLDAARGHSARPSLLSGLRYSVAQREQHGDNKATVLLDSVVDLAQTRANLDWWEPSWGVGRGADDGVPTARSISYSEWPAVTLGNREPPGFTSYENPS